MKLLASSAGALAVLATPFVITSYPAQTQSAPQNPACGARSDVVASLGMQYLEKQQAVGVVDPDTVVEVFVSDRGSWTIVATDTQGMSCIVFYGEGWDNSAPITDAAA
ncbi:MAG: hypothetical protein WDZ83_03390 [Rhizobiaceae bacterium]